MTIDDATDAVPAFDPEHDAHPSGRHNPLQAAGTILKVRTSSRPSALAGAIAGVIRQVGQTELQAIGAGAINQAVKAIAIARSYLQEEGIDLWCVPSFIDLMIDGEERTALRLVIEVQQQ